MSHGWAYLLILLGLTCPGCGHLSRLAGRTSSAVSANVQTVAVLPFEGELGSRVAEEVANQFASTGAYSIVEAATLVPTEAVTYAAADRLNNVMAAARQKDIDAVLTGEITESSEPDDRSPLRRVGLPRDNRRTLTVEYRLVDTRTGETLSKNRVRSLEPRQSSTSSVISPDEVEDSLIAQCSHEVVSRLTPRRASQQFLAQCPWSDRGVISVKKGNCCARDGDWSGAVESWEAALAANPDNDAALFNLALAASNQYQFDRAEKLAMQALRIHYSAEYEQGLEKIREQRSVFEDRSRSD